MTTPLDRYEDLMSVHGSAAIHAGRRPDLLTTDPHDDKTVSIRVSGTHAAFSVWLSGTLDELDDWLAAVAGKVAELRTVPDATPNVSDNGAAMSAAPLSSTRTNLVEAPL